MTITIAVSDLPERLAAELARVPEGYQLVDGALFCGVLRLRFDHVEVSK